MGRLFRTLLGDRRGNIAVLFGLCLLPMVGIVGLAVDTARAFAVRSQLQQALDAAALAGGRLFATPDRDSQIQGYFDANIRDVRYGATVSPLAIAADPVTGKLTVAATATLPVIFARVLGYSSVNVGADVEVVRNETTLEVALVIDTTGSMNQNDSSGAYKMTAAKDAANLLLNILYTNKDEDEDVFLSVVPFVQNVNVGNEYSSWLASGTEAAIPWNSGPYPSSGGWRGCMFERLDSSGAVIYDTTDTTPATQKFMPYADTYFGPNCPAWTAGEKGIVTGMCRMNAGSIYFATASGTAGAMAPTHTTGLASDGSLTWQYRRPAYSNAAGYVPVNCPLWTPNTAVSSGECRMSPPCPDWVSGESVAVGACRFNASKIYTATSAGTTGGAAPTHTGSSSVSDGGVQWRYRTGFYVGVGANMYYAGSSGTTGTLPPVHTGTSATSDGSINWTLWRRQWVSGQATAATGSSSSTATDQRGNPWYFVYRPTTTGTTSGTVPPTHTSGSVTSGSITWAYSSKLTAQDPYYNSQYGIGYNSGCGSKLSPLSNSRLTAKAVVDALQPSTNYGGTMTPIGLVWGWRTISPSWRGLWANVPEENPYDYDHADNYKAVIILTDGDNNFMGCSGRYCRGAGTPYGYLADNRLNATNQTEADSALDDKVTEVCEHIRSTGTLIYAVMFDLPAGSSSTRTLFRNCVGSSSHFFDAVNAEDLQTAFQTIAVDLSRLRLSK